MGVLYKVIKIFALFLNVLCLLFGIAVIALNALGLERSLPSTDEHTFFIVGIILSSFVCMATLIGCYGVVCEILGINIVYSLFVFTLLVLQCLQMKSYPAHAFYSNAVERLEHAWRLADTRPYLMSSVESTYSCCGLYDSRDYNYEGRKIPKSCYMEKDEKVLTNLHSRGCLKALHDFYQSAVHREILCNWAFFSTECIGFICSVVLSVLLSNPSRTWSALFRFQRGQVPFVAERPVLNHVNSRTNLISA